MPGTPLCSSVAGRSGVQVLIGQARAFRRSAGPLQQRRIVQQQSTLLRVLLWGCFWPPAVH